MQFSMIIRRRLFGLLVPFIAEACDEQTGPRREAEVAGLNWTARVDTFSTAPQQVRVTMVARNTSASTVRITSTQCPVGFSLFLLSASGKLVYASPVRQPNPTPHSTACFNLGHVWTLETGDTAVLSTVLSVPELMGDSLSDTVYAVFANAEFAVRSDNCGDVASPPCRMFKTPEIEAGSVRLRRQQQPLPDLRVEDGLETKTWLEQFGETARVVVQYRNLSDTTQIISLIRQPCDQTLSVSAYRERSIRDYAYNHPGAAVFGAGENDWRCQSGVLEIAPGQSRLREIFFVKSQLLATAGPGTYYLLVRMSDPRWARLQSAGEITVP